MPLVRRRQEERSSETPVEELRATLVEHIDELRQRILRIVWALVVGMVIGWLVTPTLYQFLEEYVRANAPADIEWKVITDHVMTAFILQIKLSFYVGLMIALPFAVHQIWAFIAPGLRPHERKPIKALTPVCIFLFLLGMGLGWITLPAMFQFFFQYNEQFNFPIYQDPQKMIELVVKTLLSFGIAFQMPVVVFFLSKLGLITPEGLRGYWRQVVITNVIAAAIITPGSDPVQLIALSLPMIGLFFVGVYAAQISNGKRGSRASVLDHLDSPPTK